MTKKTKPTAAPERQTPTPRVRIKRVLPTKADISNADIRGAMLKYLAEEESICAHCAADDAVISPVVPRYLRARIIRDVYGIHLATAIMTRLRTTAAFPDIHPYIADAFLERARHHFSAHPAAYCMLIGLEVEGVSPLGWAGLDPNDICRGMSESAKAETMQSLAEISVAFEYVPADDDPEAIALRKLADTPDGRDDSDIAAIEWLAVMKQFFDIG
ncbi:MAG: hypothetical protein LBB76_07675 [Azoarcus sp.]|jgi:hypothetical protein|nr:hypothetical protein [Azoarcus sp.]